MSNRKRLCVLQVTPAEPNPEHVKMFADKQNCDFYFVTHDEEHKDALQFCPNTTWTDTRNVLAEKVPKNYDYYAFVDYDYNFRPQREAGVLEQMIEDLDDFNPAVLTYYPGEGLHTPYATNTEYRESRSHSVIPFTHCGLKIVHHTLMDWFFPMVTKFGGGFSSCHLFNILEIPFLSNVVCSHKMIYDNSVSDSDSQHNKDVWAHINMDKMWMWIYPYFNKRKILRDNQIKMRFGDNIPSRIEEYSSYTNSMHIKEVFVNMLSAKTIEPQKNSLDVDYWDTTRMSKFFDLQHEYFTSKKGTKPKNDTLIVVGNGPSLKEHYFDLIKNANVDTFGLNSAYRYFEEMGWYPTYYGCFDYALTESHNEQWSEMILDENCPIEKFFHIERPSIEAMLPHTECYFSDEIRNHPKFVERPHNQDGVGYPEYGTRNQKISCTGANAVRTGIELGYKKIILIGHDATYVQSKDLKEAEFVEGCRYVVSEEMSENPNYASFWPDYQRQGDLFHNPGDLLPAWLTMAECVKKYAPEVEIVNCSEGSRIECFRMAKFEDEI